MIAAQDPAQTARSADPPRIRDYAVIGDCRSAALISRSGSVDWLCLPDFSSQSFFAAILDSEVGGQFAIRPSGTFETSRRYLDDTPVLQTVFACDSGIARITDAMIPGDPDELNPAREIVRIVEGLEGEVAFELLFAPRPEYGRKKVRVRRRGRSALVCSSGADLLLLRADVPLEVGSGRTRFAVAAGERRTFSLAFVKRDVAVITPLGAPAESRVQRTAAWWRNWSEGCTYDGPYRSAVRRSAITLKLMSSALSGAVVAAPTTSLPEAIGGERNWDYRYCWLRDAALTMRAMVGVGLLQEAGAFLQWLLHATALTRPELNVMYDVYGRVKLRETELGHLAGYRGSRPVRIGNDAYQQVQLDVYGGVISAAVDYALAGGLLQKDQLKLLAGFGKVICEKWREPDHGIWEQRGRRKHYTFSKLMCWLGLDSLLRLSASQPLAIEERTFRSERDAIRAEIERSGFRDPPGSYVGAFGEDWLDASLLLMSCLGYCSADDPRMRRSCDTIREQLGRNGLIYRYLPGSDGLQSTEGAFGICSFWMVDNLASRGEVEAAHQLFERLLNCANDLLLFSEENDADTGELLGNFPQAFTHVGLINAALALQKAQEERRA